MIAMPLTEMISNKREYDFARNAAAKKAFQSLKKAITSAPVLAVVDENVQFELVCDACDYGIGAVLMQSERPVSYFSYKLNSTEGIDPLESKSYWGLSRA